MSGQGLNIDAEYDGYLERFQATVGDSDFGVFVKHEGKLVKKLRRDEFAAVYTDYYELAKTYIQGMERGDTINDMVVRMLRQRAAELFLTPPV